MKKFLLLGLGLGMGVCAMSQNRVAISSQLKNVPAERIVATAETNNLNQAENVTVRATNVSVNEAVVGTTRYDLQSNSCTQNRLYRFADGTFGAAWTFGLADPSFADRGTGYNYFDGQNWGDAPDTRIEGQRNGWPSYAAWGENGEVVVSHSGGAQGLIVSTRENKGEGEWTFNFLVGPASNPDLLWPRMVTSGENHEFIHVIAITPPTANQGNVHEGLDGAVLYSRSSDGGQTWEIHNEILDGMTSDDFFGFSGDTYVWAEPSGDNLAFMVADNWIDAIVMKSADNGDTWAKTTVWEHPYPKWNNQMQADTTYCPDGASHLAFDNNDKLHVVFGVNRCMADGGGANPSWFPFVDGVCYWNEDMDPFVGGDQKYILDPDALFESGNLVGWMQDWDQNGQLDLVGTGTEILGLYYLSPTGMPQINVGPNNEISVVMAMISEGFDNGAQQYRHVVVRGSADGENWGPFVDLTNDILHMFDECVFPSVAAYSDDKLYMVYQADEEPGLAVRGDEDDYTDNNIIFMEVDKQDYLPLGVEELAQVNNLSVSQNMPNPFSGSTRVEVKLQNAANVTVEIYNLMGQKVAALDNGFTPAGTSSITINAAELNSGVYFYTVNAGGETVTNRMVVK